MLTSRVIEGTDIIAVDYEGSLASTEIEELQQRLRSVADEQGSARLLVEYGDVDLGRVEPKAAWKDLQSMGMLDQVSKCAVVTDAGLIHSIVGGADKLASTDIEVFDAEQRDEALVWLRS